MKMTEEQIYEEAKKRVEEKRGFYTHLVVYIVVNIMLVLIWWFTIGYNDGFPWFVFPLGGWGIGLLFHFLGVFFFDDLRSDAVRLAQRIYAFLGLDDSFVPETQRPVNKGRYEAMPEEDRALALDTYREEIEGFADDVGRDLSHWLQPG